MIFEPWKKKAKVPDKSCTDTTGAKSATGIVDDSEQWRTVHTSSYNNQSFALTVAKK